MKYEYMFKKSRNKEDFVILLKKHFGKKEKTAIRTWFRYRKKYSNLQNYMGEEKDKPNILKIYNLNDMKKYNMNINRTILLRNGFTNKEINWLEDNGMV